MKYNYFVLTHPNILISSNYTYYISYTKMKYKKRQKYINNLECDNEYKMINVNTENMKYISDNNNIKYDILTKIQKAQKNTNDEFHELKYKNMTLMDNKLIGEKKNINNNTSYEREKGKDNIKINMKKGKYKDIPLTRFFQKEKIISK